MSGRADGQALARAERLREQRTEAACAELGELAARWPEDAGLAYLTACAHDSLGLEAEAAPHYERALAARPGLSGEDRHGAFLGLGSTYRVLGRYPEAVATLRLGLDEFPGDAALRTFLAMALHNTGESAEAVRTLLRVTAATSADARVRAYRRAIDHYADHLDEVVPGGGRG
ncbi:tetratricopeptide repeat protein [Streptacidiphilus cavernicola]|uniref:Tetratricopeptide repeat protein n=1 Tax=Streptacidiphilus cavernicola TaxID=3342716 RepID=A0ABV6W0C6_9ACTN